MRIDELVIHDSRNILQIYWSYIQPYSMRIFDKINWI